jgi:ubiquinone biosynthesis protein COQ9
MICGCCWPHIADAAAFDGWSEVAVRAAAQQLGVNGDVAAYAFAKGRWR